MRKISIFTIFLVFPFIINAQKSCSGALIDFETENEFILFDTSSNLWEIGQPDKIEFKDAYSGENAIVTKIDTPYDDSVSTFFQIKTLNNTYGNQTYLSFWHKWKTDTINDYGYIEYSFDGGNSWHLGENKTFFYDSSCWTMAEVWHFRNFDPPHYHSNNVSPFFSGSKDVWVKENYYFSWWQGLKSGKMNEDPCTPDSILFKFNFKSDNENNLKDGWIIDDILVEWDFIGSIESNNKEFINIYPNPTNEQFTIENKEYYLLELISSTGSLVLTRSLKKYEKCSININKLKNGIYILRLIGINKSYEKLLIKE